MRDGVEFVLRIVEATQVPERLREVLVLRFFEDLGEREIAEIVGVPTGTVKSRLHAAVRALRGMPEEHDVTH